MNDSRFVDIAWSLIKGAARPLTIVSEDSDRTQSKNVQSQEYALHTQI